MAPSFCSFDGTLISYEDLTAWTPGSLETTDLLVPKQTAFRNSLITKQIFLQENSI